MAHNLELHPEPPPDLSKRELPLIYISQQWFRIFRCDRDPLYFNRSNDDRFNAPTGEYGVMYLGGDEHCAFIETLGHDTGNNTITMSELAQRCLCIVASNRPLALVDLTGAGLARLGSDNELCAGRYYDIPQRWALALWSHAAQPDGIYYRARHDPARFSLALFDRAEDAVREEQRRYLADPAHGKLLADMLELYSFDLLDDRP